MKCVAIAVMVLVGCVDQPDDTEPAVLNVGKTDAGVDTAIAVDACSREPSGDCCALLPDEDAARACVAASVNPGDCGVLVCWQADCSLAKLNFCGPTD